jgi:hypothetical protein
MGQGASRQWPVNASMTPRCRSWCRQTGAKVNRDGRNAFAYLRGVRDDAQLSASERQVLIMLALRAGGDGTCYPSVATLARDTGLGLRTIRRTIRLLTTNGRLVVRERHSECGDRKSNLYVLQGYGQLASTSGQPAPAVRSNSTDGVRPSGPEGHCQPAPLNAQLKSPVGKSPLKSEGKRPWRRVPDTWQPNDAHHTLAASLGVNLEHELGKFRDHEFAKSKSDPDAAFRNWIRGSRTYGTSAKGRAHLQPNAGRSGWETVRGSGG